MSSTAWLILTIVGALGSAACLYGIYGDKKLSLIHISEPTRH